MCWAAITWSGGKVLTTTLLRGKNVLGNGDQMYATLSVWTVRINHVLHSTGTRFLGHGKSTLSR